MKFTYNSKAVARGCATNGCSYKDPDINRSFVVSFAKFVRTPVTEHRRTSHSKETLCSFQIKETSGSIVSQSLLSGPLYICKSDLFLPIKLAFEADADGNTYFATKTVISQTNLLLPKTKILAFVKWQFSCNSFALPHIFLNVRWIVFNTYPSPQLLVQS